jgi:membrane protease subunit (stomatin/prohibitin family)
MRGRGLMLVAGMKMGQNQAQAQAQQQAQHQQEVQQAKQEGAAQAQAAAPPTKDVTAELQKLADLHKSGALTDEEFAAMKKKLLGL